MIEIKKYTLNQIKGTVIDFIQHIVIGVALVRKMV